jgi:hypothetical protein
MVFKISDTVLIDNLSHNASWTLFFIPYLSHLRKLGSLYLNFNFRSSYLQSHIFLWIILTSRTRMKEVFTGHQGNDSRAVCSLFVIVTKFSLYDVKLSYIAWQNFINWQLTFADTILLKPYKEF